MRLSEFILRDMEPILAAWEHFAATLLPAAGGMTSLALRDHAREILEAVAADLEQPQTPAEQRRKSLGKAPRAATAPETAAETHAILRAKSGFDINQLAAEYRALRASVLRQWLDAYGDAPHFDDVIRFNEAIDQAIAESVSHFTKQVEQSRNLLLGMLGHDMRSPLNSILMTAEYLAALNVGESVSTAAARLIRSGAAMQALLDDLVDFNRSRLGLGLSVVAVPTDVATLTAQEIEQTRAGHPGRQIVLDANGDTQASCDPVRMQQVLRNLLGNAIRYGDAGRPIRVAVSGDENRVVLDVTNEGPAIDATSMARLFDPLQRGTDVAASRDGGLGLGLYIVREIARAHGGDVAVRSEGGKTSFRVTLPRGLDPRAD